MRQFKVVLFSVLVFGFLLISCQKEERDQSFEQTIVEQSEVIEDTPENLEQEKTARELSDKQLATSGMKGKITAKTNDMPEKVTPLEVLHGLIVDNDIYSSTFGEPNYFNGYDYLNGCLDKYYSFNAPDKQYFFNVTTTNDDYF